LKNLKNIILEEEGLFEYMYTKSIQKIAKSDEDWLYNNGGVNKIYGEIAEKIYRNLFRNDVTGKSIKKELSAIDTTFNYNTVNTSNFIGGIGYKNNNSFENEMSSIEIKSKESHVINKYTSNHKQSNFFFNHYTSQFINPRYINEIKKELFYHDTYTSQQKICNNDGQFTFLINNVENSIENLNINQINNIAKIVFTKHFDNDNNNICTDYNNLILQEKNNFKDNSEIIKKKLIMMKNR
jgi:hypothetical protein